MAIHCNKFHRFHYILLQNFLHFRPFGKLHNRRGNQKTACKSIRQSLYTRARNYRTQLTPSASIKKSVDTAHSPLCTSTREKMIVDSCRASRTLSPLGPVAKLDAVPGAQEWRLENSSGRARARRECFPLLPRLSRGLATVVVPSPVCSVCVCVFLKPRAYTRIGNVPPFVCESGRKESARVLSFGSTLRADGMRAPVPRLRSVPRLLFYFIFRGGVQNRDLFSSAFLFSGFSRVV